MGSGDATPEKGPPDLELVPDEGAPRRRMLARLASVAAAILGLAVVLLIPGLDPTGAVVLASLLLIIIVLTYLLDNGTAKAYRRDHLCVRVILPIPDGGKGEGGASNSGRCERAAESVRSYLSRNRISHAERKPSSRLPQKDRPAKIFLLENWSAELTVRCQKTGSNYIAHITVGPVTADTEPALRKMMAGLKQELELEFGKRNG